MDGLTSKKLSTIVVDVCNPALIMASILSGNMTAGHKDLIYAVILGAAFYAVLVVIGFVMPRILRVAPDKRKFYNLMSVYTNTGFLGIPVAKAILPANAILYVVVVNIMYSLLFYTHGLTVLGKGETGETSEKGGIRHALNPGTIMAILSLLVFWFNVKLPPILANTVEYVGNATVFLSMALLGVAVARSNVLKAFKDGRIWAFIALRMILFPLIVAVVLKHIGLDETAILAMCLMAEVPVGNLPMIQAEKKGMDISVLSAAIAVTTAVSLITITLLNGLVYIYVSELWEKITGLI